MEIDKKRRKLVLQELSDFILSSQHTLENTLQTIGWDKSKLSNISYKTCPFDPGHQIPEQHLEKHLLACQLKQEDYSKFDDFLPDSTDNPAAYIILDEKTRAAVIHNAVKVEPDMKTMLWVVFLLSSYRCGASCDGHSVPRTSDRIFTSSTPDERRALYDFVVEKTNHRHTHDLPVELPYPTNESKDTEPKSELEVKAKERDAKRRSVSYKRVHTNRKSHTEILREVIQSQMEMLQSHMQFNK